MSEDPTRVLNDSILQQILTELKTLNTRVGALENRFDNFARRFDALEEKVERRMQETRPIWEIAVAKLEKIDERLANVEAIVVKTNERLSRIEFELKGLRRSIYTELSALGMAQQDIEDRVSKLEERGAA